MKRLLLPAVGMLLLAAMPARAADDAVIRVADSALAAPAAQPGNQQGQQNQQGPAVRKKNTTTTTVGPAQRPVLRSAPKPRVVPNRTIVRSRDTTVIRTERYVGPRNYVPGHRPANWNVRPRHFDVHVYRRVYTSVHRYRWRPYVRPHGWYYRRWVYGEVLPRIFWVRDYWIADFWMFGLPVPPYGYEWVRYGDDAVLVNTDTGEILQVIYNVFY